MVSVVFQVEIEIDVLHDLDKGHKEQKRLLLLFSCEIETQRRAARLDWVHQRLQYAKVIVGTHFADERIIRRSVLCEVFLNRVARRIPVIEHFLEEYPLLLVVLAAELGDLRRGALEGHDSDVKSQAAVAFKLGLREPLVRRRLVGKRSMARIVFDYVFGFIADEGSFDVYDISWHRLIRILNFSDDAMCAA